ncbi:MAG: hypothetical protein INR64_06780 [Caulobacteraceae bacterium]|nr:hypothetical protein [Caulobacter sp.]
MTPLAPPPAPAAPAPAAAASVQTRATLRAFPFLDLYYKLAAARRTRFTVAYRWRAIAPDGVTWAPAQAALEFAGERRPIASSPLGWLERAPTAEELSAHPPVSLSGPAGWRLGMILAPQLRVTLGASVDPAEVLAAADQFERGTHSAGPLTVVIPHFRRVLFVGAAGGRLVDGDGRATAIAPVKGELFASLAALRAAAAVRFDTPPERVLLLP